MEEHWPDSRYIVISLSFGTQGEKPPTRWIEDWRCVYDLKKMLWGKRRDSCKIVASINLQLTELLMQKPHDNSKASPAAFMQDNKLIAVIELSLSN